MTIDQEHTEFTVASAREAAERDDLVAWVAAFLASPGSDNPVLAEHLASQDLWWLGPVRLPLSVLHRLAGPPGERVLAPMDEDDLETVEGMEESIDEGWEPPPLIVSYSDGQLVVEDGTHRVEGLRRAGRTTGWSLVCFDDRDRRDAFVPPADPRA
jgi:hypothetical protein